MTYNITVQGSSETHECDEHEPILECLERNHMLVECDCRVGVCGTCKVELITGTVDQDEQATLDQQELDSGMMLSCVAYPRSDCVVRIIS
jgi:ferredoxin